MNDKFFDLKQEKQDRMINASLKIFSRGGYRHASTDEIVKEAGISKGLLFHYFGSKLGLYGFLFDYSARFMLLELSREVKRSETDYFALTKQISGLRHLILLMAANSSSHRKVPHSRLSSAMPMVRRSSASIGAKRTWQAI